MEAGKHVARMNAAEIRRAFAEFCGVDRYRQFVATIWSKAIAKQRLVFWQEQLWREFSSSAASPLPASFEEIQRVFRVCPRHLEALETLEPGRASAVVESLADVGEDEWLERYPFSVANVTQGGVKETLSCPACRSELEARITEGPPGA
jgi:hypothetical protein